MDKQSTTLIYGLIGYPVKHSLSPVMHKAAFNELKINADYRLFEVRAEELEGFLQGTISVKDVKGNFCHSKDIVGFNITIPHKVRAKEILEKNKFPLSDLERIFNYVKLSGAVNTVKRKTDGTLEYTNTDYKGFSKSLKEDLKFNTQDKNILLIGCGGAGRTVVSGLVWKNPHPKKIFIYEPDSDAEKSAKAHFNNFSILEEKIEFIFKEQIQEVIKNCQLLVNASPVGMKDGDSSIVDKNLLHDKLSVYDVVYNRETQLIKDAKSLGRHWADGLGMLLYQGASAFEFWTGQPAPIEVMREALNEGVNKI